MHVARILTIAGTTVALTAMLGGVTPAQARPAPTGSAVTAPRDQNQCPRGSVCILDVFERDWAQATPYATGPQAAHGVSQTMKQTILVMLAKGLKDDTIARRLGISLRTCRRHVSELLETLGAHSRFEAGVIAERQGLLTHHPAPPPAPVPPPAIEAPVAAPLNIPVDAAHPAPDTARSGLAAECLACSQALPARPPGQATGRPARYCSPKCRSRAYRARRPPRRRNETGRRLTAVTKPPAHVTKLLPARARPAFRAHRERRTPFIGAVCFPRSVES
ncbi:response regulator transcription factor [Streptomyces virginiae]|uniref:helix-turn-helix transcriptional regulator n=1 Tax=Streptomyces virginiae TaxID=1961 RepID=UPI0037227CE5